jgi:uncharacterized membrane protein
MSRGVALPVQVFSRHRRTWIAVAVGILTALLLPKGWPRVTRVLVAWDCGVVFFLGAVYLWMRSLTAEQLHSHYVDEDPSGPVLLAVITAAALLSLIATVELLATLRHVQQHERLWHFVLAAATLVESWLLVPTLFTMHYADMFYSAPAGHRPLAFPQTDKPVFWDFAYFSFTIAAASQTAEPMYSQRVCRSARRSSPTRSSRSYSTPPYWASPSTSPRD